MGAAFERAVKLNPNNADALVNNAYWRWFQKYTLEGVEDFFQRALEIDPLSLARYAALGEYYGQVGQHEKMLQIVEQVKQNFDTADAYRLIGWLLELDGRLDESAAWLIRARDREPHNADHVAKLAELYALMGDFEMALQLNPEPGMGLLLLMRRYEEMIDVAEFLMIERPEDVEIRYWLAFAYNATGQFERAVRVMVTTGQPDTLLEGRVRSAADFEGFLVLVNALAGAGQTGLASELALFFINIPGPSIPPDWWRLTYSGCGLAILEQDEEALQNLESIMERPRLPWLPVLQDSYCFQRFETEPVYRKLLDHARDRQAAIREKLPATLDDFGVSLYPSSPD